MLERDIYALRPRKGRGFVFLAGVSRFRLGNKAWVACGGQSLASKNIRLNINDTSNEELLAAA
jgi:hypothetical protein